MAEQNTEKTTKAEKPQKVNVTATLDAEQYAKVSRARHTAEFEKRSDFVREAVIAYADQILNGAK